LLGTSVWLVEVALSGMSAAFVVCLFTCPGQGLHLLCGSLQVAAGLVNEALPNLYSSWVLATDSMYGAPSRVTGFVNEALPDLYSSWVLAADSMYRAPGEAAVDAGGTDDCLL
jgi:hypothetical protein